jgi:hypothetical protein
MLCDRCSIAISDILTCNLDSSRWKPQPLNPGWRIFYLANLAQIVENSLRKVCFVCQTAHNWLSNPSRPKDPPDNGESKGYFFSVPLAYATSDPPLPWALVVQELFSRKLQNRVSFRLSLELYFCGTLSDRPNGNYQPHQL